MIGRVVSACLVLAACGGEPRQTVRDLVAELPIAEVLQEASVIDVGTAEARRHLARGWYADEGGVDGPTFVWSEGDQSDVEFVLLGIRDVQLVMRCRPFEPPGYERQVISPSINGNPLPDIELETGFASYRLELPAASLADGRNRLTLRYSYAVSPRDAGLGDDWRRLAVALDVVRFEEGVNPTRPAVSADGSRLEIPAGSLVAYHLRHLEGLRFEVDAVEVSGDGGDRLRVLSVSADGTTAVVSDLSGGQGPVSAEVPGSTGEPVRLELRSTAEPVAGRGRVVSVIVRPRLSAVRERKMPAKEDPGVRRPQVANRPNVIIYLVDALRADRLGTYGQARDLSPHLDRFAAAATVYDMAWAQTSWTRPAVASLFTGLRPEVHGTNGRLDRLGEDVATLAERFSEAGYSTAAVVANPNISAEFGFDRGFHSYLLMEPDRRRSTHLDREVARWLDEREPSRPFLLYVHTVDPHLPYQPPEPYRSRFAPAVDRADLGTTAVVGALQARHLVDEARYATDLLALYDGEVACNDHAFGLLLEQLRHRGLDDDTVVVFLSDHGEEFFEHGGWIHGRTLYREVLQVPLVIRGPGQRQGRRVTAPVQHADLMPTLLEFAGLEPQPGIHGVSLLGPLPRSRSVAAFLDLDGWGGWSVVAGSLHAIRHVDRGYVGPAELYDLELDSTEREDLGQLRGVEAGGLLGDSRREVLGEEGKYRAGEAEIDHELRRRLEALGYL